MNELQLLRETRLFSGCREEDLERLAAIARRRGFADGELLFSHGDEARELMIVETGTLQLEVPLTILGADRHVAFEAKTRGDVIGWSALAEPNRVTLSCRCHGGASVLAFPREEMVALLEEDTRLGYRVMRNLVQIVRLRLARTQVMWSQEIQRALDERYR